MLWVVRPAPGLAAICFLCGAAFAQNAPAFDVASVKSTLAPRLGYGVERVIARPGSLIMSNVRLRTCIQWAYGVRDYQIDGPGWLGPPYDYGDPRRFEIAAKAPSGTPIPQLRLMLASLLADRFRMALHRERRNLTVCYISRRPAPHKLQPSTDAEGEFRAAPSLTGLTLENATIEEFASLISGPLRMPVLDRTGLHGRFNFALDFSPYPVPSDFEYLYARSIREQLGLDFARRKASVEMLIVDRAEKQPAEN